LCPRYDNESGQHGWSLTFKSLPEPLSIGLTNLGDYSFLEEAYGPVEVVVEKVFNHIFQNLKTHARRMAAASRQLEALKDRMGFKVVDTQLPLLAEDAEEFPQSVDIFPENYPDGDTYVCRKDGTNPHAMRQWLTMQTTSDGTLIGAHVLIQNKRYVILEVRDIEMLLEGAPTICFRVREV